jgi:hypothetical protein
MEKALNTRKAGLHKVIRLSLAGDVRLGADKGDSADEVVRVQKKP